jgi:hypothetical protein
LLMLAFSTSSPFDNHLGVLSQIDLHLRCSNLYSDSLLFPIFYYFLKYVNKNVTSYFHRYCCSCFRKVSLSFTCFRISSSQ